jgi:6-phospho-3-hexuloisomerase
MSFDNLPILAGQALDEMKEVFNRIQPDTAEQMCSELLKARRIAIYGCGREGLMLKALGMRLMHLGLDAHIVGDMSTPPVRTGDLLLVSAGPGAVATVLTLMDVAKDAGASTMVITAQPEGLAARKAGVTIYLPAQTMANDTGGAASSILPMGSLFEIVQLIFFDLVVLKLQELTNQSFSEMRERHTNLE